MSQGFYCSQCGARQESGDRFCHGCGRQNTPQSLSAPSGSQHGNAGSVPLQARKISKVRSGHSVGRAVAAVGGVLLLICAGIAIATEIAIPDDEPQAIVRTSALLADCGVTPSAGGTASPNGSMSRPVRSDAGIEYQIVDARGALEFREELALGRLDDGRGWLIVSLVARNHSDSSIIVDSDDIQVNADGEQVNEAGDVVDDVNERLGLRSMGDMLGTRIDEGTQEEFALIYKVPQHASSLSLVFREADSAHVNLRPFLRSCRTVSALVPTPAPTPLPTSTPTPRPTVEPKPTATITPSPTPTLTPTPVVLTGYVAGDWEIEVESAYVAWAGVPTDDGPYEPAGFYVAVPVTATNTSRSAQEFSNVARAFVVLDGLSRVESPEGWFLDQEVSEAYATTFGFADLNALVPVGHRALFVLVFDVSRGHNPNNLFLSHVGDGSSVVIPLADPIKAGEDDNRPVSSR